MRELKPFIALYKKHWFSLSLGMFLALLTLCASIGLLTLSGWFIAASAVAGIWLTPNFNYMLPAAGVRGFSITRTAGRWGERVVSHNATFKLLADIRISFFNKLAPLIPNRTIQLRDADILNRLVADVNAMDHIYLRLVSPFIIAILSSLGISAFLYWFEPILGISLGIILFMMILILPIYFYQLGEPHGVKITQTKSALRIHLLDWIQGNAELHIYGAAKRYRQQIHQTEMELLTAQQSMAKITGFSSALLIITNGFTLILMIWLAATYLDNSQANPVIAMVAFATMASFELLVPIAGAYQYLSQTRTSAVRLNEVLQSSPETIFSTPGVDKNVNGHLNFHQVYFSYQAQISNSNEEKQNSIPASHFALKNISLSIKAGEKIAILGQTGCGKSTLLQLLTRTWDPCQGHIHLDQIPLDQWQEARLRQSISVVNQRVDLFNGSLRSNLQIAKVNATDAELSSVLTQVDLAYLLDGQGLNTWIGEGGRQLSGGEKRRIGIARVLLRDAAILLLDEPTEGLDVKTEQDILELLFRFAKNKTMIFVTHRLMGLTQMDRILLMDQGEIVEQGTHQSLLSTSHYYAQLHQQIHG